MLNLLARMKQHLKEVFSMSINLIRNGEGGGKSVIVHVFHNSKSQGEGKKKSKKLRFAFNK